jgi:HAD superfamily hydrolase (TIGR01509 family)
MRADLPVVVFDLDGTLVDSLPATVRCFQDAVAPALGRVPPPEEIFDRFGPADQEIVSTWVGPEHAGAALDRLYRGYAEAWRTTRPFPGVTALLEALLAAGRRLALFTGRGRASTDALLAATRLSRVFAVTVTGEEVPRPKPAPDGILAVLERLGAAAEDAVYVGDTVKDVEAARGARVLPVAALWGSPEPEALRALDVLSVPSVEALRGTLLPQASGYST